MFGCRENGANRSKKTIFGAVYDWFFSSKYSDFLAILSSGSRDFYHLDCLVNLIREEKKTVFWFLDFLLVSLFGGSRCLYLILIFFQNRRKFIFYLSLDCVSDLDFRVHTVWPFRKRRTRKNSRLLLFLFFKH